MTYRGRNLTLVIFITTAAFKIYCFSVLWKELFRFFLKNWFIQAAVFLPHLICTPGDKFQIYVLSFIPICSFYFAETFVYTLLYRSYFLPTFFIICLDFRTVKLYKKPLLSVLKKQFQEVHSLLCLSSPFLPFSCLPP